MMDEECRHGGNARPRKGGRHSTWGDTGGLDGPMGLGLVVTHFRGDKGYGAIVRHGNI